MFICPNPNCKKSFANPLKTLNIQRDPTKPYNACPHCLTEINDAPLQTLNTPQTQQVVPEAEIQPVQPTQEPSDCRHHLGYLSERTQKEQIPDDCLVCKEIVECMLKKMR